MTERKTKTVLILITLWIPLSLLMNIITLYSSLGLRLPIGWTDRNYPNRCQDLESKDYQGLSYFVEPGFPFRYERSGDDTLDSITLSEYCGESSLVSTNKLAAALNWFLVIIPIAAIPALIVIHKKAKTKQQPRHE